MLRIRDIYPGSRISYPGIKKAPDPGFQFPGIRVCNTGTKTTVLHCQNLDRCCFFLIVQWNTDTSTFKAGRGKDLFEFLQLASVVVFRVKQLLHIAGHGHLPDLWTLSLVPHYCGQARPHPGKDKPVLKRGGPDPNYHNLNGSSDFRIWIRLCSEHAIKASQDAVPVHLSLKYSQPVET